MRINLGIIRIFKKREEESDCRSLINTWDLLDQATNFLLAVVVGSELDIQTHLADSDLMMMMVLFNKWAKQKKTMMVLMMT